MNSLRIQKLLDDNLVYYEYSNGFKEWVRYSDSSMAMERNETTEELGFSGLPVYYKNSLGDEFEARYDEKGNLTYYKDKTGVVGKKKVKPKVQQSSIHVVQEDSEGRICKFDPINGCWHIRYPLGDNSGNIFNIPVDEDKPLETWLWIDTDNNLNEYYDNYGYHYTVRFSNEQVIGELSLNDEILLRRVLNERQT